MNNVIGFVLQKFGQTENIYDAVERDASFNQFQSGIFQNETETK